ncbi:hypothetical protein BMI76_05980 [Streptococcus sp. 'caviae']|nr:hypothetical protein BMI76_05980 [Streptococcus sp. 'caviae']
MLKGRFCRKIGLPEPDNLFYPVRTIHHCFLAKKQGAKHILAKLLKMISVLPPAPLAAGLILANVS